MSRWNVSPPSDLVTAPLELINHKSNPSCLAMGNAKACLRPVTRTISMPAAWALRRAIKSPSEIWNCGLSSVPSMSVASSRIEGLESITISNANIRR